MRNRTHTLSSAPAPSLPPFWVLNLQAPSLQSPHPSLPSSSPSLLAFQTVAGWQREGKSWEAKRQLNLRLKQKVYPGLGTPPAPFILLPETAGRHGAAQWHEALLQAVYPQICFPQTWPTVQIICWAHLSRFVWNSTPSVRHLRGWISHFSLCFLSTVLLELLWHCTLMICLHACLPSAPPACVFFEDKDCNVLILCPWRLAHRVGRGHVYVK